MFDLLNDSPGGAFDCLPTLLFLYGYMLHCVLVPVLHQANLKKRILVLIDGRFSDMGVGLL